jgi:hypothetical protein
MKVFVNELVFDTTEDIIGVILNDQDKENIAKMGLGHTVYAAYDTEKHAETNVNRLIERVKKQSVVKKLSK